MTHTTHYRVSVNNKSNIVLLDKPLKDAQFFKNPHEYCTCENSSTGALVHYGDIRIEYYFRNYKDAIRYFNYLHEMCSKNYEFFNVFSWQTTTTII